MPIIGTSVDTIEDAEDREKFKNILHRLGLKQPASGIARNMSQARTEVAKVGFPALVRPSFVLGGRAMEICYDAAQFERFVAAAFVVAGGQPVLIDRFLEDAIEVDVDAIADGQQVIVGGIMEHIEEAGVHSGDSACALPPFSLPPAVVNEIRQATRALAERLQVKGLMNVQYAVKREDGAPVVYVLEVNPRASRTVPFVSKATGMPLAKAAAKVMVGVSLAEQGYFHEPVPQQFSVKEAVFPFAKFAGIDVDPRPGNEIDRRGDGHQRQLFHRLRQKPGGGRHGAAHQRASVHQRQQAVEGACGRSCPTVGANGFRVAGHEGDGPTASGGGRPRASPDEGAGGAA